MTADKLLSSLHKVKQARPGYWLACCPAHNDTSPSLSVKETDDGVVLLKCWAGCSAADIVQAAGLQLQDLFPPSSTFRKSMRPSERWMPRDVLEALVDELMFGSTCCSAMATGKTLTEEDAKRLALASSRIYAAWLEVKT